MTTNIKTNINGHHRRFTSNNQFVTALVTLFALAYCFVLIVAMIALPILLIGVGFLILLVFWFTGLLSLLFRSSSQKEHRNDSSRN